MCLCELVKKIIVGGETFSEFGLQVTIKDEEIEPDLLTSRLLMYYPWETDTKVCVWTNAPRQILPMYNVKLIAILIIYLFS